MAYLEGISLRSSDTLRQWFKKLQCILPGNFAKNNLKPSMTRLLRLNISTIGDDVFQSQKNLDVIMYALRRDLVSLLRKSNCNNSITMLIYKLNILDNNIREICRIQHTWANYPATFIESLKVQEKCIIRLIEEIMDDIFDTYSSIRRKMNHFSLNERSINGIISVLGILKREVCNMIYAITLSIEQHHQSALYEKLCAPPNAIAGQYLESIDNEKVESPLPIENTPETVTINREKICKSSEASLPNNRSYPFIEKGTGAIFSSLQDICCGLVGNKLKENSDCFDLRKNVPTPKVSEVKFSINDSKPDGCGDADNNHNRRNEISFNPVHFSCKREDSPSITKTVNTYFAYAEKNKASLLSYNNDQVKTQNVEENCTTYVDKKTVGYKLDDSQKYLYGRTSGLSWPSAEVVRDIKSETNLDGTSKHDRSGRNNNCKDYYLVDESWKEDLSDSDSDDSYISCALDEFQFEINFLDQLKEKYLKDKSYIKTFVEYAGRNDTKIFSCKSPKLSEIFTGPKIIRREESLVPEIYHSVESLPTVATCNEEMSSDHLSRETKSIDVAISTNDDVDLNELELIERYSRDSYFGKKESLPANRTFLDSFNTLALSEDNGGNDTRYTQSIMSFASVATETMDVSDKDKVKPKQSASSHKSLKRQRSFSYGGDLSPHLQDSQYSAICLALPPSSIRLVNIGNEINLLAIEVEQT